MKKWTAWLLLASMLLLGACGDTGDTSSASSTSSQPSQSPGEDSSATEIGPLKHTVVSVGKPYTLSSTPHTSYPDLFGTQLTDGQKAYDSACHYTDVRMVGFTQALRIDLDLGDDGKGVTGVSVRALDIDTDGVKGGFDLEMLDELASRVNVPIIASGGAGKMEDFAELFTHPGIDAGLAASIFHFGQVQIPELKGYLAKNNINVRL